MSTTKVEAPAGETPFMTHRQIMLVIFGLMAGMFLSSLDQTIVSTAIRTIGDDLKGLDQQAWVTTAYMITSTITTPIYGKLSDVFGRRPLYLFGIGVFIIGSLLSTFSTSMIMLAAFRAFQGIGAGALMSLPMAIMGDMLAPRERAKYQGYFLAVFGVSSVLGPLIGGLFSGASEILWIAGWRWVFLINVPIGIIAFGMVWVFLHLPKVADKESKPVVDWWGSTFVIIALVPLLLVAEQGREWGWGSAGAIACYVIGAIGIALFVLTEMKMGKNALLPLKLFNSFTFSMATILSFFVGFGMFGAMMTIPLFLQIVLGLTPTESGWATLPITAGIMLSSIVSGILIGKSGKYRIYPVTGTLCMAIGFILLTFMTIDRPLWYLMICMFLIGLGLGQLMQTLTLASQNAVAPQDMGVATSGATFFRQIGGTLGTAVLLSVLFTAMPTGIQNNMGDEATLKTSLQAALDPSVASASENQAIMDQMWNNIINPVKENIQTQLDDGSNQAIAAADQAVTDQVTQAVDAQNVPADQRQAIIDQQVEANKGAAEAQALQSVADQAHASVIDGKVQVDWSNEDQRNYWVDQLAPKMAETIRDKADSDESDDNSSVSTSDTSFLNGADSRLTRPFMLGFNDATIKVYWVGFSVIALAFVLTWFFKVPPLRAKSALQEQSDGATTEDEIAPGTSSMNIAVHTGSIPVVSEATAKEPVRDVRVDDAAAVSDEEAEEESVAPVADEKAAPAAKHAGPVLADVVVPAEATSEQKAQDAEASTGPVTVAPLVASVEKPVEATVPVVADGAKSEPQVAPVAQPQHMATPVAPAAPAQQPSWLAISAIAGASGGLVGFIGGFIAGRASKK